MKKTQTKNVKEVKKSGNGKKVAMEAKEPVVTESVRSAGNTPTLKTLKKNPYLLALGILLLGLVSLIYYFRSNFIAATVNGQPIWRRTLNRELNKQFGQQTLDNLITETLIKQQASANGVVISDEKVASETARIESSLQAQGQTLDQVLLMQGMDREELAEQLKLNLMVENLSGSEASPSAEEVSQYIKENSESLPTNLKGDELSKYVTEVLTSQKKSEAIQTWIGNLRQGAKIQTF